MLYIVTKKAKYDYFMLRGDSPDEKSALTKKENGWEKRQK